MMLQVDPDDPRPIYRQLVEELKTLIASGALAAGEALPSVRQVAADLGVNLNTVAAAYRELASEGLVAMRRGARAVVATRTAGGSAKPELQRSLRSVLAGLVLAGLSRAEIMRRVTAELRELTGGAR